MELKKDEIEDRIFEKRLHIAVSLIGPFYTLFTNDITTLIERNSVLHKNEKQLDRFYQQVHRSIISPYGEHSKLFDKLRILIENDFKDYKFVPFVIHSAALDGLQVRYRDEYKNRIYHALFNQHFEFDTSIVGDQYKYGFDQWLIENPNMENYWEIKAPNKR